MTQRPLNQAIFQVNPWAVLDSLTDGLAILDCNGTVCYLNVIWEQQSDDGSLQAECRIGMNYLACHEPVFTASSVDTQAIARGLQAVLSGMRLRFDFAYFEPVRNQQRWFGVAITPYVSTTGRGALVHRRIFSGQHQPEQAISQMSRRTEQRMEEYAGQQQRLLELARSQPGTLQLDELIQQIHHTLYEMLKCDLVELYLLNRQTSKFDLVARAGRNNNQPPTPDNGIIPPGAEIVNAVFASSNGELINDVQRATPHGKHLMGVPLRTSESALGVVLITRTTDPPFTPEEFALLRSFMSYVALVLEHARLFADARKQTQELDLLVRAGMALALERDLPTMSDAVVETTRQLFGYHRVALYLLHGKSLALQQQSGFDQPAEPVPPVGSLPEQVASTGQPMLLHTAPAHRASLHNKQTVSVICVPLCYEDRVVGVLQVESTGDEVLLEDDMRLLNLFSPSASLALERARLYGQTVQREQQYRSVIVSIKEVIFQTDRLGICTFLNPAWIELTGFLLSETIGAPLLDFIHRDDRPLAAQAFTALIQGERLSYRFEARYLSQWDTIRWAEVHAWPLLETESLVLGISGTLNDITERKAAEERLQRMALYDALTGLPNRAFLMERLQQMIDRMHLNPDYLFAMLFLDLDNFKVVNDSLGHLVGDEFLKQITVRLRDCLRTDDIVARLGGDEFTILLHDIRHVQDATDIADRIQQILAEPLDLDGHSMVATASMGIALGSLGYKQAQDLLRDADTAMYHAKEQGKAQYALFDPNMHTRAMERLLLQSDLQHCIERQELRVYYQPVVELTRGQIIGFEALLRWQHPQRGLLPPVEFVAVAEETGSIIPIGRWVLYEACRQLRAWQLHFPDMARLTMSVNLSNRQFRQLDLNSDIETVLQETGLAADRLNLEMSESIITERATLTVSTLTHLQAKGVRLCIDDFGTGNASLSYLHDMPVHSLKIDGSLVSRIERSKKTADIVRTMIVLARHLGMQVIAEGVETSEQAHQIKEMGCDYAQGYFFSNPLESAAIEHLLIQTAAGD